MTTLGRPPIIVLTMNSTEQKYINMVLAELYQKAIDYTYKAFKVRTRFSAKERAVYRALAEDASKSYNFAVRLLGPLGSSDTARAQKIVWSPKFRESLELLDEDSIEDIVFEAYKISRQERASVRTQEYQKAMEYLNKHPQLAAEMLNAVNTAARASSKLDSKKGGLVRYYVHTKGLSLEDARKKAQDIIDEEEIIERAKHLASEDINSLLENQGLPNDNSCDREASLSGLERKDSFLDLLGPAHDEAVSNSEHLASEHTDSNFNVEGVSHADNSPNNDSSSSDDFSVFDTEDQVLEEQAPDIKAVSQTSGTQANKPLKPLNPTQQLIAGASAADVARALLEQAGVKSKIGVKK